MTPKLKKAFDAEIDAARHLYQKGQLSQAFTHLETAHVLGQQYVLPHIESHWLMLKISWRRRSMPEVIGQAVRIFLGAVGSAIGIVPTGNTGGTNISTFKRLPISPTVAREFDTD